VTINKYQSSKEAVETAKEHGFPFGGEADIKNLDDAVGELHEGSRHIRENGDKAWAYNLKEWTWLKEQKTIHYNTCKKYLLNTVEMEIADCHIRLQSIGGHYQADFGESGYSRLVSLTSSNIESYEGLSLYCAYCIGKIAKPNQNGLFKIRPDLIHAVLEALELWCSKKGIDLEWFIKVKMEFNKGRPYLHLEND